MTALEPAPGAAAASPPDGSRHGPPDEPPEESPDGPAARSRRRPQRSLRGYLAALLLLALLPPMALAIWLGAHIVAAEQRELEQGMRLAADELADSVDRLVLSQQRALAMLAEMEAGSIPDRPQELRAPAAGFLKRYEAHVLLASPGGQVLMDTRSTEAAALPRLRGAGGRAAVRLAAGTGRPAVSDVLDDPRSGARLVVTAVPVWREGRVVAVLAAVQDVSALQPLVQARVLPRGWVLSLRDATGQPIASSAAEPTAKEGAPDGVAVLSDASGWSARVDVAPEVAAAPLRKTAAALAGVLLLIGATSLTGGIVVARRLGLAVAALADGAEWPQGAEWPKGAARVRELERARERLQASRRERAEALDAALAAHDLLHETLARVSDGFVAHDRAWRFTFVNRVAAQAMGVEDETTLPGRLVWEVMPEMRGRPWHRAAELALASGQPQRVESFDAPSRRWFEARIYPSARGLSVHFLDTTAQRQAQEALRASEERYRMLFATNPIPMWVFDHASLRFLDVNDAALHDYGYRREEFLALRVTDLRPAGDVPDFLALVGSAPDFERHPVRSMGVHRHRTKEGRLIDVQVTVSALACDGPQARLASAVDITARVAAERERAAATRRLRELMERVSDGFVALDRELRLTYVNDRAAAIFGAAAADAMLGRPFHACWRSEGDDALGVALREALQRGAPRVVEHRSPDGARWLESRIYPSLEGVSVLLADVTERRRVADIQRASEQRYRELFDANPNPTYVRDNKTMQLLAVNDAALRVYGYSREEMLAMTLLDLRRPDAHDRLRADLARVRSNPTALHSTAPRLHRRKDGSLFEVEIASSPIDFEDRPARLVVATIVTERVRAEAERDRAVAALREREERLRLFVEQAPVSLAMFDREMRYVAASRQWLANLGREEDDVTGRRHHDVFPGLKPEWHAVEQRGLAGEVVRAEADRFVHPDGRVQWLRWEVQPWIDPASGAVGGILIYSEDITRRVADERALREAEVYQRSLFEAIGDGVLLLGADHRVLDANPKALAMLGCARAELLACRLDDLVAQRDRLRVEETLGALSGAGAADARVHLVEWEQRRCDGASFPAEVSARAAGEGRFVAVLRDISERRAAERALVAYQMDLSELARRLLTQERETTRHVAQTLHDQLGQSLATARLRLDAATARMGAAMPEALREECERVGAALERAIADVRVVLGELRPPMLGEQGFVAALDNEIRSRVQDAASVDVLLEVEEGQFALRWPGEVEYAAFMVAREAIVNAQLHAGATLVRVIVEGDASLLRLEVVDDGRGMPDLLRGERAGHLGIVGMRERAMAIGAHFAIEQPAGGGTRVVLCWTRSAAEGA